MVIPSSVKIGAVTYKVIITPHWEDDGGYDGECVYDKRGHIIYIKENLSQEAQEETLIHEALHAMNATMDHEFLDSFSEQIYQFLKDNKLIT